MLHTLNASPAQWIAAQDHLVIDWTALLGHPCEVRVQSWQLGLATETVNNTEAQHARLADIGDWLLEVDEPAVIEWRASIPTDILKAVAQLPDRRVALLEFAAQYEAARDLLQSNPKLLWLLFEQDIVGTHDLPTAARLLASKQRQLLPLLGLAESSRLVRLLRKAASSYLSRQEVRNMADLLADERICAYFSHQSVITAAEIKALKSYPWLASCPAKALIPQLADRQVARWFSDTIRMLNDLAPLKRCRSQEALIRLHDRLVDRLNNRRMAEALLRDSTGHVIALPAPPLPDNSQITALKTQREIVEEGVEMRHCIGSYLSRVVAGEYAVYKMSEPERLTIGLVIRADGSAVLDDIRGRRNARASQEAEALIESWFIKNNAGA